MPKARLETARLEAMCPFFIVSAVPASVAFYRDQLGFDVLYQQPEPQQPEPQPSEPRPSDQDPFFAVVQRQGAMLFIKSGMAVPLPNAKLDPEMRWDAYVLVSDPDALADEFLSRGARFSKPLKDTHEGLRGFEITDPDGYVLFFGRPK